MLATGLLHVCGIVIGLLGRWRAGAIFMRVCGAGIALVGFGGFFATFYAMFAVVHLKP